MSDAATEALRSIEAQLDAIADALTVLALNAYRHPGTRHEAATQYAANRLATRSTEIER